MRSHLSVRNCTHAFTAIFGLGVAFAPSAEAHVHGAGTLQVTVSDTSQGAEVTVDLRATGSDILGFERAPRADAERKLVSDSRDRLEGPAWLRWPTEASCVRLRGRVTIQGGHDAAHAEDEEREHDTGHTDWHVQQVWRCSQPPASLTIRFSDIASTITALDAQFVTPTEQGAATLTPDHAVLALSVDP
jgi:hypothetical protein